MYIVKKIVVKSTIALFAGVASAVGTQAGLMMWERCLNSQKEKTEQPFIRRNLKVVK